MEFLRHATNPWGQEILVGVAWDLLLIAFVAGVGFAVVHAIWVRVNPTPDAAVDDGGSGAKGLPQRIERHSLGARTFHWLMALTMFVLLFTAFLPIVGIRFPWVTIHWIAGIGLTLTIVQHILQVFFKQDFWSMTINLGDIREGTKELKSFFSRADGTPTKTGKYPVDHKLYHHAAAIAAIGAIVTGLLMMLRVDTPFWSPNPYILSLSDGSWGLIYVVHGVCSVGLVTLTLTHVYFAIRPEKRWITISMINGWITRDNFLSHHDPERWKVTGKEPAAIAGVGGAGGVPEGVPQDKAEDGLT